MAKSRLRWLLAAQVSLLAIVSWIGSAVSAQEPSPLDSILIDGHLHTPSEIVRLLDRSPVIYELSAYPDSGAPHELAEPVILPPGLTFKMVDGEVEYSQLSLKDTAAKLFDHAEYLFGEHEYQEARAYYRQVLELGPSYTPALICYGDTYYSEGNIDSAAFYFAKAVEANPVDYQARWFLADALWESGDTSASIEQLTHAHILNVHHADMFHILKQRRFAVGEPWREWSFIPTCSLSQTNDTVRIVARPHFLGYALAKAIWAYEPGYADKMRDITDPAEMLLNLAEEKEAVACALVGNDSLRTAILEKLDISDFTEFLLYEVIAKKQPEKMLLLAPQSRDRIVNYLNKYH